MKMVGCLAARYWTCIRLMSLKRRSTSMNFLFSSFLRLFAFDFFSRRIAFCLDVHNEAVKSMRYPPDESYKKKDSNKDKDAEKNDEKTIEELIKELEDDFDE